MPCAMNDLIDLRTSHLVQLDDSPRLMGCSFVNNDLFVGIDMNEQEVEV
jgi:hypothetical protein